MTRRRCFLPDPEHPGALHLLTVTADSYCAPLKLQCLKDALAKWESLFTVKILEYSFSMMGFIMLAYVPNCQLTQAEATQRTEAFDKQLQANRQGHWMPRVHDYTPERLNDVSEFMKIFVRDFMQRHTKLPVPKGLPEGCRPYPKPAGRFKARTVQHTALPPVFDAQQLLNIKRQLHELGFTEAPCTRDLRKLLMSPHGIGTWTFLQNLEQRCQNHLASQTHLPLPRERCPAKKIVPFDPDAWNRRLGELSTTLPYERYPKVWNLLMNLDAKIDELKNPESFRATPFDPKIHLDGLVLAHVPITLALMLTDGLLRWYYKTKKGVEFPHYNYYRELESWEV